jgi:hypothetical protein
VSRRVYAILCESRWPEGECQEVGGQAIRIAAATKSVGTARPSKSSTRCQRCLVSTLDFLMLSYMRESCFVGQNGKRGRGCRSIRCNVAVNVANLLSYSITSDHDA